MAQTMQFWDVAVKSGQSVVVDPAATIVHLSQACLDELKNANGNDSVSVFVKTDAKKLVLGHLYADSIPQVFFDLFFCEKFELSHSGKNGSIHFSGYTIQDSTHDDNAKPKMSFIEESKDIKSDQKVSSSDDDDDDSESESEDGEPDQIKNVEDSSEDDESSDDDDSEEESDESEEDEETPKKVDVSKKRPAESIETPLPKKAKFVTPEKTGGKKGAVHVATPYPSKQTGKKPSNTDQTKQQSSKASGSGAFRCDPCNRTFNSDGALQSHSKAKHGAAK